jgi:hypothetical protein
VPVYIETTTELVEIIRKSSLHQLPEIHACLDVEKLNGRIEGPLPRRHPARDVRVFQAAVAAQRQRMLLLPIFGAVAMETATADAAVHVWTDHV